MAIYRFWLNAFCEDRSETACRVSIDLSHLSPVGDPNPVNQALYLDPVPCFVFADGGWHNMMYIIYDQDRSIARFAASNGQSLARGLELIVSWLRPANPSCLTTSWHWLLVG